MDYEKQVKEALRELMVHAYNDGIEWKESPSASTEECLQRVAALYAEPVSAEPVNAQLLAALRLAKDMFIANDLSLPRTFEVIDEAIAVAEQTKPASSPTPDCDGSQHSKENQ